jgi:hypothetical protein
MKRSALIVLMGLGFIAALLAIAIQRNTIRRLQDQAAYQVWTTPTEPGSATNAVESSPDQESERRELLQLRNEVSRLSEAVRDLVALESNNFTRQGLSPGTLNNSDPAVHAKASWGFQGFETPEATLQSCLWSLVNGDRNAYFSCAESRQQTRYARELSAVGEQEFIATMRRSCDGIDSFQVLTVTPVSEHRVQVAARFTQNRMQLTKTMFFERASDGWKLASVMRVARPTTP